MVAGIVNYHSFQLHISQVRFVNQSFTSLPLLTEKLAALKLANA